MLPIINAIVWLYLGAIWNAKDWLNSVMKIVFIILAVLNGAVAIRYLMATWPGLFVW